MINCYNLDSEVANVEDRNVDKTAVEKLLSDRNVLDYLKALDEAGNCSLVVALVCLFLSITNACSEEHVFKNL